MRGKKKANRKEIQALSSKIDPADTVPSDSELVQVPISGPSSPSLNNLTAIQIVVDAFTSSPEPSSWADRVMAVQQTERDRNEGIKLKQNPNFALKFDPSLADATEVSFSAEDLDEGVNYWKHSLIDYVVGAEISWP